MEDIGSLDFNSNKVFLKTRDVAKTGLVVILEAADGVSVRAVVAVHVGIAAIEVQVP